ncbi:Pyruvate dehydrogenase phosphatase regulatory subunit, mitochondrial [Portunus trituberculatus]|uniref:Pyruvate dehydrogenase phosphatase regulatory subunit, mitochondrial n=1 Tax=Portunus trituberculatus TaxID=210409 RepID=A0A5B7DQA6_PORTR|nr:Pyruvate dehydrogenase phosphatase regulatory subunit, mitochondrial [Portunus trituberculatus]
MMASGTVMILRTINNHWKNASFVLPSSCRSFHTGGPVSTDILQGRWASSHQYQQLDLEENFASSKLVLDDLPPKEAKVVVCGGGMVGTSVLYHLAMLGWGKDVVMLEQGRIGGASSWRGSGFLGGVKLTGPEMKILCKSKALAKELSDAGHDTGWKQCGGLHLARTRDRITHFRKMRAIAEANGTECYILSPEETAKKCDIINTSDLVGSFWVPNDGVCDPYKLTFTLLKLALEQGAHVVDECHLSRIMVQNERVVAVETSKGMIECDYIVNTGGLWARNIGQMSEPQVKVPVHPAEHYFLYTQKLDGIDPTMPALRDPDGNIYIREFNGGFLCGGFEKWAKPSFEKELPGPLQDRELLEDWDHFFVMLKEMLFRVPVMKKASLGCLYNTSCAFSADHRWILGMVPELTNYFVVGGLRSGGSSAAGGIGSMIAEWIVSGTPNMDAYDLDILRFLPAHNNGKFLLDRVREVPGIHYSNAYPFSDFTTGRCLRMSPIFPRLKAAGAVFGQVMGYERPSYFLHKSNGDSADYETTFDNEASIPFQIATTKTWTKPQWFESVAKEYAACREGVALLDYSSFAKFDVWSKGDEVVQALQYLCSNDLDIPVGNIIHTGMQNSYGGYENDCSLARTAPNHYMMIAPSIQQTRSITWLKRNLPSDGSVKDIDFIGREALEQQKKEGVKRLYVHLQLEDHNPEVDPWAWGGEPIYRDGVFVGVTTTTGYGFTLNNLICLGFVRNYDKNGNMDYVTPEYIMAGDYEVDIAGVRYSASVSLRSPSLPSKFPEPQSNRYLATQT